MKEIQLTQGKVALVDDEDFEYLNQFKWFAHKRINLFYVATNIRVNGRRVTQSMHNMILNGKSIDHIDGNGLNNQKANLRFCTQSENMMNRRKTKNKSSDYKGVSFYKKYNKWVSRIGINNNRIFLGYYNSEVDAANAYNMNAIKLFGEFANLNIIE